MTEEIITDDGYVNPHVLAHSNSVLEKLHEAVAEELEYRDKDRYDREMVDEPVEETETRPSIQEEGQSGGSGILFNEEYSYTLSETPHFVTQADERGKIRVSRDDDKKSEIQGYSAFLPSADYVDLVDNHDKNIVEPVITPDFESKNQNKKDRVGSSDGSMFTVDGTSIHGVYEQYVPYEHTLPPFYTNWLGKYLGRILHGGVRIRKLTPLECWRLQGFPDSAYEKAEQVNSDTQIYKQAGNAVTVNVIQAIGNKMAEVIE